MGANINKYGFFFPRKIKNYTLGDTKTPQVS